MAAEIGSGLGGGKRKKKAPHIDIRPTANGGYIAHHRAMDGPADPSDGRSQEYGLTDKAALMAHLDQHLPDDAESTQAADPTAGGE